jgi:hypothetical protein
MKATLKVGVLTCLLFAAVGCGSNSPRYQAASCSNGAGIAVVVCDTASGKCQVSSGGGEWHDFGRPADAVTGGYGTYSVSAAYDAAIQVVLCDSRTGKYWICNSPKTWHPFKPPGP